MPTFKLIIFHTNAMKEHVKDTIKEWPDGPNRKPVYRAVCRCGWRATEAQNWKYIAEFDWHAHIKELSNVI